MEQDPESGECISSITIFCLTEWMRESREGRAFDANIYFPARGCYVAGPVRPSRLPSVTAAAARSRTRNPFWFNNQFVPRLSMAKAERIFPRKKALLTNLDIKIDVHAEKVNMFLWFSWKIYSVLFFYRVICWKYSSFLHNLNGCRACLCAGYG